VTYVPLAPRLRAALATLLKLGYTYNEGAELWKPPLGKNPFETHVSGAVYPEGPNTRVLLPFTIPAGIPVPSLKWLHGAWVPVWEDDVQTPQPQAMPTEQQLSTLMHSLRPVR
jgi:hypothetical protein